MMYGIMPASIPNKSLEKAFQIVLNASKKVDIDSVELSFFNVPWLTATVSPFEIDSKKNVIGKFLENFRYSGAHLTFPDIVSEEKVKEISISIVKAGELNIDYVVIHIGGLKNKSFSEAWNIYKEKVKMYLEIAESNNVIFTLENNGFLHNLSLLIKFIKEIDSNMLALTLDIGHAYKKHPLDNEVGYIDYGDLSNFILEEREYIKNIHMNSLQNP